jgi:hypothetical protein
MDMDGENPEEQATEPDVEDPEPRVIDLAQVRFEPTGC